MRLHVYWYLFLLLLNYYTVVLFIENIAKVTAVPTDSPTDTTTGKTLPKNISKITTIFLVHIFACLKIIMYSWDTNS